MEQPEEEEESESFPSMRGNPSAAAVVERRRWVFKSNLNLPHGSADGHYPVYRSPFGESDRPSQVGTSLQLQYMHASLHTREFAYMKARVPFVIADQICRVSVFGFCVLLLLLVAVLKSCRHMMRLESIALSISLSVCIWNPLSYLSLSLSASLSLSLSLCVSVSLSLGRHRGGAHSYRW